MKATNLSRLFPFVMLIFLALTLSLPPTEANLQGNSIGDLAPDFDIVDIYSNTSSKLSDYLGKVVILDMFATWCGPCIAALPQIIRIQNSYNASELQIISIDVSQASTETYSNVLKFAFDQDMSWIVTLEVSTVSVNYEISKIPSIFIINQTGHIAYKEIGFYYEDVINALDELITPDSLSPAIVNPQITPNTSPLNITRNKLTLEADNIIDNFAVYETFLQIDNGKTTENLSISKGVSGTLSVEFAIPPSLLFNVTQISVALGATDYRGNSILSTEVDITVELINVDLAYPTISDVSIDYTSNKTHYLFTVTAFISDDVYVNEVTMLLKEGNQPQGYTVTKIIRDSDDMTLFTGLLALDTNTINYPANVRVEITATDITGKESSYITNTIEANTTPTFSVFILILGLFGLSLLRKKSADM